MAGDYDEITIAYEEDGEQVIEELEKVILQKGTWTTVLFRYRQKDRETGEFGPAKAALRRYQKLHGAYKKRDAVNISDKNAALLVDKLKEWFALA